MRLIPFLLAGAAGLSASAEAATLTEALAKVYQTNPTLTGARASLRAIDEGVPLAKALARPGVSGTLGVTQNYRDIVGGFLDAGRSLTASASVSYPVFQGGRVDSAIGAAENRVEAGRANLRSTEATTFTDAVAAYLNVIRDEGIVRLNDGNVQVLDTNLQASRDRFEVGDLTRTDVAQSEARLALARSQLDAARAQLTVSREDYRRIIGEAPEALEPPPPLPPLPGTPEQAVDVAVASNPNIQAARAQQEAARFDVGTARAERSPTVSVTSGANYTNYLGTLNNVVGVGARVDNVQTTSRVGLTAQVPLYQGGAPAARIRQAQARESQAIEQTILVERNIVAQARSAYANWQAARAMVQSSAVAVDANRLALEGTRAENSVGTRNVLDVLNAEQELLNSQVQLVSAQRNEYVAGFVLLAAMGRAEAENLGLDGGALYDPVANYNRVRNRASDWGTDAAPTAQATRTAGPPADVTPTQN